MKNLLRLAMAVVAFCSIALPARADLYDANVYCQVAKIRNGKLALRYDGSKVAFAGLNNGDKVQAIGGSYENSTKISWDYVKVLKGTNSSLNGKEGIVNSRYLTCDWYGFSGEFIRHEEAKG